MLEVFVIAYCIYFLVNVYTSFMQIVFVTKAIKMPAIIFDNSRYVEAANYSIEKEKLSILTTFYDFVLFIVWIGFALKALDSIIVVEQAWLKAILFIDAFIIINWVLALPFELYMVQRTYRSDWTGY